MAMLDRQQVVDNLHRIMHPSMAGGVFGMFASSLIGVAGRACKESLYRRSIGVDVDTGGHLITDRGLDLCQERAAQASTVIAYGSCVLFAVGCFISSVLIEQVRARPSDAVVAQVLKVTNRILLASALMFLATLLLYVHKETL